MEKYFYLGVKNRKNKEGKQYSLLFVALDCENSYDIVQVLLTPEQSDALISMEYSGQISVGTDFTNCLKLAYNSYLKRYELKCSL